MSNCLSLPKTILGRSKQGQIHGNPVGDGWAGAVMQKPLGIQKCDGPTDRPTDTARCRVACLRLKMSVKVNGSQKYIQIIISPRPEVTGPMLRWKIHSNYQNDLRSIFRSPRPEVLRSKAI